MTAQNPEATRQAESVPPAPEERTRVAAWRLLLSNPVTVVSAVLLFIVVFVALLVASFFGGEKDKPVAPEAPAGEFDAFAGGYPVPPTGGQELPELAQVLPGDADHPPAPAPERGEA